MIGGRKTKISAPFLFRRIFFAYNRNMRVKEVMKMITLMVLFCVFLVIAFIVSVITGLIVISPALLLIILLPVLDYLVIKKIFGRKKK